jgi:hypothetical protein
MGGNDTGQQHLLFSPQRSTKIRDISEKNSTTKSNRTKGSSNLWFAVEKGREGVVLKTYSTYSTWRLKFLQSRSFLNDLKVSAVALEIW